MLETGVCDFYVPVMHHFPACLGAPILDLSMEQCIMRWYWNVWHDILQIPAEGLTIQGTDELLSLLQTRPLLGGEVKITCLVDGGRRIEESLVVFQPHLGHAHLIRLQVLDPVLIALSVRDLAEEMPNARAR